jgi:hypothetical protein
LVLVTPSPNCAVPGIESPAEVDPVLAAAVDTARAAAADEAGGDQVGRHVGVDAEPGGAATHLFQAEQAGYRGWRWAVTVAYSGPDTLVTISEVVLLPGPDALVAPEWVPWQQRIQAGDLGIGDLMPTEADDPRLVPGYFGSDDPAVEDVQQELGLGRVRVLSRFGRLDAADRWQSGDFGPGSEMAKSAPDHCGRCGFYLPLNGSLRAAFGVCGNEMAPADGRVVHVEYGCGAHSEVELETSSPVPVADLVYDDTTMDVEPPLSGGTQAGTAEPEPEPETAPEAATDTAAPEVTPEVTPETTPDAQDAPETAPTETATETAQTAPTDTAPTETAPTEPAQPVQPVEEPGTAE